MTPHTTLSTKNMRLRAAAAFALLLAAGLPAPAHAHRAWMLPSATVLSGSEPWVTVDAAVSTDLFYADHNPMRLDGLMILAPDGTRVAPENMSTGKFRSSFDLKLARPGTYKLAVVNEGFNAVYKLNGETKRWRGTADTFAKEVPADAQELRVTRSQSRGEVFVTSGKPSAAALRPTGVGLELVPVTHPNDLVAGDTASFTFLLDGVPAAGIDVNIVPGGIRYRNQLGDIKVTTDNGGRFSIKWPAAGMYWISASHGAEPRAEQAGGSIAEPLRRASYSATLEVLPE